MFGSQVVSPRHVQPWPLAGAVVALALVLVAVPACGARADDAAVELASALPVTDELSMAKHGVDRLDLEPGVAVIVPTNTAVLAVDADGLAEMAADGSIVPLIEHWVVEGWTASSGTTIADLPDVVRTTGGLEFERWESDGEHRLGGARLQGLVTHGDQLLIVIDRLFTP